MGSYHDAGKYLYTVSFCSTWLDDPSYPTYHPVNILARDAEDAIYQARKLIQAKEEKADMTKELIKEVVLKMKVDG